jgi:hypothetical protein
MRDDPEIEKLRVEKEAAIEAQDFDRAVSLRDKELQLRRERAPQPRGVSSMGRGTITLHPPREVRVWAAWPSMLTGAALLGLGILIGRLVWG